MIKKIRNMKFSEKNKFFSLFTLFLFWGQGAWSFGTSDFTQCDELFCPKEDSVDEVDSLAANIGIQRKTEARNIRFDIPSESRSIKATATAAGTQNTNTDPPQDTAENPGTEENPQDSAQAQASGWGSGSGAGGSQAQGAGGSRFSAMGAAGGQVRGSKVGGTSLGGVNEAKKIRIEGGGAYSSNLASLNRSNRGEPGGTSGNGGNQRGGGPPSVAPSGSGGLGGSASGAHSSNTGKKKEKGFLSKLASKVGLGRYFGGGSGGGSSGNFYRGKSSGQGKLKTASKASKGRLKSPEDILRENFNRNMRRRNLANSPEFGSSRTSLFQNICEHYDNYARSHSIPDNRKHCPRD